MMKRFLSFCTAAVLILGLTACAAFEDETYKAALTSPPELTVVSGDQEVTALLGGYTWDYCIGGDQWQGVCVDCAHPLQCQDLMTPLTTTEGTVRLEFAEEPLEFTVRCWSDSCWGDDYLGELDAVEEDVTVDGYTVELKQEGYIYQVIAKWDTAEPAAKGTAYYSFYAVDTVHYHMTALTPQTVDDPVSGYCGNMITTVHLDGETYSFAGSDSVALTDILINLAYDPEKVCRCTAEFTVDTESTAGFEVNLTMGFVRCYAGQADLTTQQVKTIQEILERLQ